MAAVLLWAAVSKLRRPAQTASDFKQLGLPAPGIFARLVPFAEGATAFVLVGAPGWGGVVAFAMLTGFTALLISLVRSGRVVSCGCFGSSSAEPVSVVEIVRNGFLLVLAAVAATATSLTRPDLADVIVITTAAAVAAVVLQLVSVFRLSGSLFGGELAGELLDNPELVQ